jgi:hypothetical protein
MVTPLEQQRKGRPMLYVGKLLKALLGGLEITLSLTIKL